MARSLRFRGVADPWHEVDAVEEVGSQVLRDKLKVSREYMKVLMEGMKRGLRVLVNQALSW